MTKTLLTALLVVSSVFSLHAASTVVSSVNFGTATTGITGLIGMVQDILSRLVPILIGLAVLAFFWFLVLFVWNASDNPTEQIQSRKGMAYSLLAIFVMVSIWGIVGLIASIIGIDSGAKMPSFKLPGEQ